MAPEVTVEYLKRDTSYLKHHKWHVSFQDLETLARYPDHYCLFFSKYRMVKTDAGRRKETVLFRLSNNPTFHGGYGAGVWRLNWEEYVTGRRVTIGSLICAGGAQDIEWGQLVSQTYFLPDRIQSAPELKLACTNQFPLAVFADWLQEEWRAVPEEMLAAFRNWVVK